jgi:hypothetical protein
MECKFRLDLNGAASARQTWRSEPSSPANACDGIRCQQRITPGRARGGQAIADGEPAERTAGERPRFADPGNAGARRPFNASAGLR